MEDTSNNVNSRSLSSTSSESETEELQRLEHEPPVWKNKKRLSKQLSMCEASRDRAWERRRRHIIRQEIRRKDINDVEDLITDEDLSELKGCIELGFGFKEEEGSEGLCNTLPALDIYFAVNRQFSMSPIPSPGRASSASLGASSSSLEDQSSSFGSPRSADSDAWKICSPGDDPQHVKTKLRHWAQVVACSVIQSSRRVE